MASLSSPDAQAEWARCRPWIEPVLKMASSYTIEDVERFIEDGSMHFWPGKHSAGVTEFCTYKGYKALNIFVWGGVKGKAIRELRGMEAAFIKFAKHHGCTRIQTLCRPGAEPAATRMGYRHVYSCMAKEI